jgi:vitamin B12 transporter
MVKLFVFVFCAFGTFAFAEDVQVLPKDVVTATPLDEFSEHAQGWVSEKISKDQLDIQGGGSLYEALNKYPGIQAQGQESGNAPGIRIRGNGSASRTLVLLDGVPLNTQDGLGADPLLVPTEFLQNVELIKGPSSLFYGSDAVGGAVNLIPQKLDGAKVEGGYQSTHHSSLWMATPLVNKKNCFTQISAFLDNNPANYKFDDPQVGSGTRDNNGSQTQRYIMNGESAIYHAKIHHYLMYAQAQGQNPGPVPASSSSVIDYHRKAYLLGFDVSKSINAYMDLLYKFSWVESRQQNLESGENTFSNSYKNLHTISLSTRLTSNHQIDVFTDFSLDHYESNYGTEFKKKDEYFEHGFIWRGQLDDNQFILAGARYLPDQNDFLKNILIKNVFPNYFIWASYSEGIRLPNFTQRYANSTLYVGNPNLKPEKSNQFEVGIEKPLRTQPRTAMDHIRLKGSLFTIDYSNFIQFINTPAPYSYVNIDKVTSQGAELLAAFDYSIYHGEASYSLLSVKDTNTNQTVPLSPTSQAYLLLGAQLSTFIFELQNNFWSTYKLDSTHSQNSWITTDFSMRTSGFQNWQMRLGIQNIFNKYRSFGYGYPEPGRKYFAYLERGF